MLKLRRVRSFDIHERLVWLHDTVCDKGVHLVTSLSLIQVQAKGCMVVAYAGEILLLA